MTRVRLDAIAFDAGTQIRESIKESVVTEYAERMTAGDEFPPVVLFHDGNRYYMADGFHRGLASQRNGLEDIPADVRVGTKTDALWFALGANRANAHQMTLADKRHAIQLAYSAWPDKSSRSIAEQIGCDDSFVRRIARQVGTGPHVNGGRVTGKDGKSYPATYPKKPKPEIAEPPSPKSRDAIAQKRDRMRQMAADGHSTSQIAAAVGMSVEGCRQSCRDLGIDVPADRVVKGTRRPNATRIIEGIVRDAENLTADVNLIDVGDLDPKSLAAWVQSLSASRKALDSFIRQLSREMEKHGEAA